jgi:hypothetical protein
MSAFDGPTLEDDEDDGTAPESWSSWFSSLSRRYHAAARLGRAAATVEGLLTVGGAHNGQQGKMV